MAAQAGKAAPAMAVAGALVTAPQLATAPQAQHAPAATAVRNTAGAEAAAAAASVTKTATHPSASTLHAAGQALASDTYYKVRSGDTLTKIAQHYYGKTGDWQWLYHENSKRISDPDTIYPGQELYIPADPPANYTLPHYQPRHARAAATTSGASGREHVGTTVVTQSAHAGASGSTALSGTLGCSGLERLWENAGGNPADAFMAAEIAMAESGGNQFAVSPTNDYGYWQINASNGALATFSPYGNARAAVILSGNGSNWGAWTTYTSGAYSGRC